MSDEKILEQAKIAEWFDATYVRKGERYLRPVNAYYIFLELLNVGAGSRLLDVACGLGQLLLAAEEYGCETYGCDLSVKALVQAESRLSQASLVHCNAEELPYLDAQFDFITCIGSLERMIDVRQVLAELHRVGKPDARYCFLVRNANTFTWKYLSGSESDQRARGHQGADTLENWRALFESAGFRIDDVLPDQYPLQQRARWMRLGLGSVDVRRPRNSRRPLDRANEFLFLLEKSD